MATMADIRNAIADALSVIPDCQVSAYVLSHPTPPCLYVTVDATEGIEYDRANARGLDAWHLVVHGLVGVTSDQASQRKLDRWAASSGTNSVKAALEADRTLGGVVETIRVERCVGYGEYLRDTGAAVLGAQWQVLVLARGTS